MGTQLHNRYIPLCRFNNWERAQSTPIRICNCSLILYL